MVFISRQPLRLASAVPGVCSISLRAAREGVQFPESERDRIASVRVCAHGSVGVQMISVVSWEWEQTGAVWVEKERYGNRVLSKREV